MKTPIIPTFLILALGLASAPARGEDGTLQRRTVTRNAPASPEEMPSLATLALSRMDYDEWKREGDSLLSQANAEDVQVWFKHLREDKHPPLMGIRQWHACVNDIFSHYTQQAPAGLNLTEELIGVVREADDQVVRDYALQPLAILGGETALAALREAAGQSDTPVAGTALLNLYRLEDGLDDGSLAERALTVAADPAAHAAARSTALQIGVMLEDIRFLEPAVNIARRTP
nr:hypothetical protein [Kiritimatiellia bacterium]